MRSFVTRRVSGSSLSFPVLLLCLVSNSASAQLVESAYEPSPRRWMFELKFGPYKPNVDAEPGLSGKPYREIFACLPGSSCKKRFPGWQLMSQVELDIELWQGHGTLGLGATWGFFRISGKSLVLTDPDQPYNPESNPYIRSGDDTTFNIMPFILQVVYRWDYAARKWHVPLVPYVKGGAVYSIWWIEKADRDLARFSSGGKARGGTFGYQVNAGLSFQIDMLEPSAAKRMDQESGINHTYIFVEFVHSQVRWARDDRIRLGVPASFMAGLAMEF